MVILANRTVCHIVTGIATVLTMLPARSEACEPSDLRGRVKSVIVTEALVDSGNVHPARQVLRIDVSQNGDVAKTTLAMSGRAKQPAATSTTYFENGRPVRQLETANGKTVTSMTCSYDPQGRLIEARTGSENSEFATIENYEYGPGFIRRRTKVTPGGSSLTTQTLDANGRVIKEVVLDETSSAVQQTSEITYEGNRRETCGFSARDPRRQCATTVQDSHGNETEFVAAGQTRKTSFEYDTAGNWVYRRVDVTGPLGTTVGTIVQRKIEYW